MNLYLPLIEGNSCGMNEVAKRFVNSWLVLLGDRVSLYHCDDRLVRVAQAHAEWLDQREDKSPSMHIGINGSLPNWRVRNGGYSLPSYYPDADNEVESDRFSVTDTPEECAVNLAAHPSHHSHMLGLDYYSEHTVYGVGYYNGYYICLIAPKE